MRFGLLCSVRATASTESALPGEGLRDWLEFNEHAEGLGFHSFSPSSTNRSPRRAQRDPGRTRAAGRTARGGRSIGTNGDRAALPLRAAPGEGSRQVDPRSRPSPRLETSTAGLAHWWLWPGL